MLARTARHVVLAGLLTATLAAAHLAPPTAWAAEGGEGEAAPAQPDPGDLEKAGKFYEEGVGLYRQELYLAAVKAFLKAHELAPNFPKPIFNIAKSYEKLGMSSECVSWYEKYVETYEKTNKRTPPDIVDIKNSISKCRLGMRLEIEIESEPSGASVYIDDQDKLLGQTPFKTRLDPGEYTVWLKLEAHQDLQKKFVVKKGEAQKFVFRLQKVERVGAITVKTNVAGAQLYVDGKNRGRTPYAEEILVEEGRHQVSVEKEDYVSAQQSIDVKSNQKYEVELNLWLRDPPATWKKPLGWTTLVLGALLVGGGVGASVYADTLFQGTPDFETFTTLQTAGYAAGGALAGIGVILLIWEAVDTNAIKESDRIDVISGAPRPTVAPFVSAGPDGGVGGLGVRF